MIDGKMAAQAKNETEFRWVAPDEPRLHWEHWGELCAVFDERSGDTHMLAGSSARVLQQLVRRTASARELVTVLESGSGEAGVADAVGKTAQILQQLHSAGLIEKEAGA